MFPHLTEELWTEVRRQSYSIHQQSWPGWDETVLAQAQVTLVVQVNGKVRERIEVAADISEDEARKLALGNERVLSFIGDATIKKIIYIPGRLINIVARNS